MDNKSIGNRIRAERESKGLRLQDIAEEIGVARSTIQRYEAGNIDNIKLPVVAEIARVLGVTPEYLIGKSNNKYPEQTPPNLIPMPKFNKRIPILGTTACGEPILAVQEATEYIDIDDLIDADFALYCKGDSMIDARIYDGDIVCIREQPKVEEGEIAAVVIEDFEAEATLKRVYIKEDRIILRPCNVIYDDTIIPKNEATQVRILGKATHFIGKVK